MPLLPSKPATGAQLRAWRLGRQLTQAQVARSLGVSASTIGRWERRDRRLPAEIVAMFPDLPALTLRTESKPRAVSQLEKRIVSGVLTALERATATYREAFKTSFASNAEVINRMAASLAPKPVLPPMDFSKSVLNAYQSRWVEIQKNAAKTVSEILKSLAPVFEQIAAAFPSEEEFERVSLLLADRGWFLGLQFPIGIVRQIDELHTAADAEAIEELMQDYVRERAERTIRAVQERCPDRTSILDSALAAHLEGRYELSVPVLLAQADGVARDVLGGHFFQKEKNPKPRPTKARKALEQKLSDLGMELDNGFIEVALAPLYDGASIGLPTWDRNERRAIDPLFGPLNRHARLHGLDTDYGTEGNSGALSCYRSSFCPWSPFWKTRAKPARSEWLKRWAAVRRRPQRTAALHRVTWTLARATSNPRFLMSVPARRRFTLLKNGAPAHTSGLRRRRWIDDTELSGVDASGGKKAWLSPSATSRTIRCASSLKSASLCKRPQNGSLGEQVAQVPRPEMTLHREPTDDLRLEGRITPRVWSSSRP